MLYLVLYLVLIDIELYKIIKFSLWLENMNTLYIVY